MSTIEYYLGKRSYASIAKEATYGAGNTATNWSYPGVVQRWTPDDKQDIQPLLGMDSSDSGRQINEYYPMVPTFGGTLEMLVQHGRMLALGIGADTVTGSYTHTIQVGNVLPSFAMQVGHYHSSAIFGKQYQGCVVNRMDINFSMGDWIRYVGAIVAQKAEKITAFKPYQASVDCMRKYTTAQMRPYRGSDSTFTINNTNISGMVTQGRLSLENSLQVDPALDAVVGNFIAPPVAQIARITAGLNIRMKESTYWDLFRAGGKVNNCSFKMQRGDDSITFNFDGVWLPSANEPIDVGQGIVIQDLDILVDKLTMVEVNSISTDYDTVEA